MRRLTAASNVQRYLISLAAAIPAPSPDNKVDKINAKVNGSERWRGKETSRERERVLIALANSNESTGL